MSDFRQLSETVFASPQISPSELDAAREMGITCVINNRPDGEEAGQPQGAEIEKAARERGLDYVAIPVTQAGFSLPQIDAMGQALASAEGKVLAFCRSGTRSTFLWALAQTKAGLAPSDLHRSALAAGYDISPIATTLEMLAGAKSE